MFISIHPCKSKIKDYRIHSNLLFDQGMKLLLFSWYFGICEMVYALYRVATVNMVTLLLWSYRNS